MYNIVRFSLGPFLLTVLPVVLKLFFLLLLFIIEMSDEKICVQVCKILHNEYNLLNTFKLNLTGLI